MDLWFITKLILRELLESPVMRMKSIKNKVCLNKNYFLRHYNYSPNLKNVFVFFGIFFDFVYFSMHAFTYMVNFWNIYISSFKVEEDGMMFAHVRDAVALISWAARIEQDVQVCL